jgi:hypothetical protein
MSRLNTLRCVVLFITLGLSLGFAASVGAAPPTLAIPDPAVSAGAFDRLSPGDQKIARALFESQSRTTLPPGTRPLALDQIAAMKQKTGWGVVFKEMKERGLVTDKNLGRAVSRFEKHHGTAKGPVTTAAGRKLEDRRDGGPQAGKDRAAGKGDPDSGGHGRGNFGGDRDVAVGGGSGQGGVSGGAGQGLGGAVGHGGGRGR